MPKPNFLIVGAAKSGTTSAYEYLRQHPSVYMPDWKEPSFFAPPEAGGVTTKAEYLALFDGVTNETAIGEASVAYLYDPDAPQKILNFLGPDVKIIIFLRNPVDMAYSNWGHQTREGYESFPFEQAIHLEETRLSDPNFYKKVNCYSANLAYIRRARYKEQIWRYDALFPAKNIKIFIYEEFFKSGLPQWDSLCEFLSVSSEFKPEPIVYNAAGNVRSRWLQKALRQRMGWKEPIKALLPLELRGKIKRKLEKYNRFVTSLPELNPSTRKELKALFASDIIWLEQRLNKSLKEIW